MPDRAADEHGGGPARTSCARAWRTRSTQILQDTLPKFVSTPAPLSQAIDAIERGVARRSARVWALR